MHDQTDNEVPILFLFGFPYSAGIKKGWMCKSAATISSPTISAHGYACMYIESRKSDPVEFALTRPLKRGVAGNLPDRFRPPCDFVLHAHVRPPATPGLGPHNYRVTSTTKLFAPRLRKTGSRHHPVDHATKTRSMKLD